jgi:cis-3-alkyl-4-acyloxetan-2-one decarboxylase
MSEELNLTHSLKQAEWTADFKVDTDLYPFSPKSVMINAHRMSYLDEGDPQAIPTIMVHGNPTWSFYYRHLVQTIKQAGGRALVLDHIGCGFSDKPNDSEYNYTLSQRVTDLAQWIETLGLSDSPFHMVVHDWGGMIGCAYATQHANRLRKLVVLNTAAFHIPGDKKLPLTLWLGRNSKIGQFLIQGLNAFSGLATRWACSKPLSKAVRRAYCAPYHSWSTRIATHRFVKDIPLHVGDPAYETVNRTQAGLSKLKGENLLIAWGLQDFVFDETFLHVWQARFPKAQVHRFEDSGHYILEDQQSVLLPLICDFIMSTASNEETL